MPRSLAACRDIEATWRKRTWRHVATRTSPDYLYLLVSSIPHSESKMASFTGSLDLHKESHITKNVADTKASANVEAARKGMFFCEIHPGMWVSKPGMLLGVTVRDCPQCLQGNNTQLSSRSNESSSYDQASAREEADRKAREEAERLKEENDRLRQEADRRREETGRLKKEADRLAAVQLRAENDRLKAEAYRIAAEQRKSEEALSKLNLSTSRKQFSDGFYVGQLVNDKMNGRGVYTYASGDRYEGDYKDDKMNGRGVYTYADGDRYDGDWKDGIMNGRGVFTDAWGGRYEGDWIDGKKHGRGVYTYADGSRDVGVWKDGTMI